MNAIPEEFQIKTLLNQDTYLVNGVEKWEGQTSGVLNDFIKRKYEPTILGSIPFMGEKKAWRAVDAADAAFNNGQEYGPP
jgi:glyceraldehyde-3-phosphate dehydrogenase (NADP+)